MPDQYSSGKMRMKVIHLGIAVAIVLFLSACSGGVNGMPEPHPASKNTIEAGRHLIASYGCGSCHFIPGVAGANGTVGPPLDRFYERMYIAGHLTNTEENLVKWIRNPQQVIPGTAMPNMGVTDKDAQDIAAYLYHQPTLGELIRH